MWPEDLKLLGPSPAVQATRMQGFKRGFADIEVPGNQTRRWGEWLARPLRPAYLPQQTMRDLVKLSDREKFKVRDRVRLGRLLVPLQCPSSLLVNRAYELYGGALIFPSIPASFVPTQLAGYEQPHPGALSAEAWLSPDSDHPSDLDAIDRVPSSPLVELAARLGSLADDQKMVPPPYYAGLTQTEWLARHIPFFVASGNAKGGASNMVVLLGLRMIARMRVALFDKDEILRTRMDHTIQWALSCCDVTPRLLGSDLVPISESLGADIKAMAADPQDLRPPCLIHWLNEWKSWTGIGAPREDDLVAMLYCQYRQKMKGGELEDAIKEAMSEEAVRRNPSLIQTLWTNAPNSQLLWDRNDRWSRQARLLVDLEATLGPLESVHPTVRRLSRQHVDRMNALARSKDQQYPQGVQEQFRRARRRAQQEHAALRDQHGAHITDAWGIFLHSQAGVVDLCKLALRMADVLLARNGLYFVDMKPDNIMMQMMRVVDPDWDDTLVMRVDGASQRFQFALQRVRELTGENRGQLVVALVYLLMLLESSVGLIMTEVGQRLGNMVTEAHRRGLRDPVVTNTALQQVGSLIVDVYEHAVETMGDLLPDDEPPITGTEVLYASVLMDAMQPLQWPSDGETKPILDPSGARPFSYTFVAMLERYSPRYHSEMKLVQVDSTSSAASIGAAAAGLGSLRGPSAKDRANYRTKRLVNQGRLEDLQEIKKQEARAAYFLSATHLGQLDSLASASTRPVAWSLTVLRRIMFSPGVDTQAVRHERVGKTLLQPAQVRTNQLVKILASPELALLQRRRVKTPAGDWLTARAREYGLPDGAMLMPPFVNGERLAEVMHTRSLQATEASGCTDGMPVSQLPVLRGVDASTGTDLGKLATAAIPVYNGSDAPSSVPIVPDQEPRAAEEITAAQILSSFGLGGWGGAT